MALAPAAQPDAPPAAQPGAPAPDPPQRELVSPTPRTAAAAAAAAEHHRRQLLAAAAPPPRRSPPRQPTTLDILENRAEEQRWALSALVERDAAASKLREVEAALQEERGRRKQAEAERALARSECEGDMHRTRRQAEEDRDLMSAERAQREAHLGDLRERLAQEKERREFAERCLAELEQRVRELTGALGARTEEKEKLAAMLRTFKQKTNAWRIDSIAHRERLRLAEGERTDLSCTVVTVGRDRDGLRDGVENLQRQYGQLEGENRELRSALSAARSECAEQRSAREELVRERDALTASGAQLTERCAELERELAAAARSAEAAQTAAARAHQECEAQQAAAAEALAAREAAHAAELRRSDEVHARHCNDLLLAARAARRERDRAARDACGSRRQAARSESRTRRTEDRIAAGGGAAFEADAADLRKQVGALRGECRQMEEALVARSPRPASSPARRAFDTLHAAQSEARCRSAQYRRQLSQATADLWQVESAHSPLRSPGWAPAEQGGSPYGRLRQQPGFQRPS
eukprot:TRINITY_DN3606_c0_g2_i1.p1 TRINITY_DN3606_c0_g2~~TRINITY_DN3606_c0_g2_i1.p1  ORF type:complete len:527 (+),score=207.34 TRINITY_DN3606_c0_g2_i1:69-1649(+)